MSERNGSVKNVYSAALVLTVTLHWHVPPPAGAKEMIGPRSFAESRNDEAVESERSQRPITKAQGLLSDLSALGDEVIDDAKYIVTSPLKIDGNSALILGGVAAAIGGLMVVDENIQKAFQDNRTDTGDDIANGLESIGSEGSVVLANVGLIGAGWLFREYEEGNKLMRTALVSLESQLFVEGIAGMTKFAMGRARPDAGQGAQTFDPFEGFDKSFPSSHAARSFAVAAVFADAYPQPLPFLAYTGATLIALSRVYVNEHFASDVVAGAALGFVIGKVLSWRHHQSDSLRGWTILPFAPDARGGLGLTVHVRF